MIGAEFTGVLHAAQQGRAAAFSRLWADANPSLTRYLRVVSVADADDVACETWVTVVRRLPGFEGDETAWRSLIFSAARMHAEDGNQRRVWDALVEPDDLTALVTSPLPAGEEPFEDDEVEGGPAHGLRMTIGAIRDLPPEQGEVLMLRLVGELPEASVAELTGADTATVHGLEQQALDSLGADAELVSWALSADPRPVEVADEDVLLAVFSRMVPERVQATRSGAARGVGQTGAKVITLPRPTWRTRAGVAAGTSLALVGLGALSAAAYQGVLPDPVQVVLHKVIGAPPPATSTTGTEAEPTMSSGKHASGAPSTDLGQEGAGPAIRARVAAVGLCRAWEVDRGQSVSQDRSAAFRRLVLAAGGEDHVADYCAAAGRPGAKPTNPPTAAPSATARPTATATEKPTKDATTRTHTAEPKPEKTKPAKAPSPTTATTTPTESPTTTEPAPETTSDTGTETGGAQKGRGGRSTSAPGAGNAPVRR